MLILEARGGVGQKNVCYRFAENAGVPNSELSLVHFSEAGFMGRMPAGGKLHEWSVHLKNLLGVEVVVSEVGQQVRLPFS